MFLIRTVFWLVILVLLLPTNEQQQNQVYGTAQAAVKDVSGFCERNPSVCATGKDAFAVFMQKARFGAEMLMGFVKGQTGFAAGRCRNCRRCWRSWTISEAPATDDSAPATTERGKQSSLDQAAVAEGGIDILGRGAGDGGACQRRGHQFAKHAEPERSFAGLERAAPGRARKRRGRSQVSAGRTCRGRARRVVPRPFPPGARVRFVINTSRRSPILPILQGMETTRPAPAKRLAAARELRRDRRRFRPSRRLGGPLSLRDRARPEACSRYLRRAQRHQQGARLREPGLACHHCQSE